MGSIWLIGGFFALIGMLVQGQLQRKFTKYSQIPFARGWSGKEVAEQMLRYYGIYDVQIVAGEGTLTDHYNPLTKTVQLSGDVYSGRSIAAAAVAAHECGHAVQHATAYSMLTMRSQLVPVVNIASTYQQYVMLGCFLLASRFPDLLLVAIALFSITTAFALITLPVEFDASRRALAWLDSSQTLQGEEYKGAKDALTWAALTYVVAALASVAQLVYLVMMYAGRRR